MVAAKAALWNNAIFEHLAVLFSLERNIENVKIRAAHAVSMNLHQHLIRPDFGRWPIFELNAFGFMQNSGFHGREALLIV
ncbi:MAG TPA: hypothetical protein VGA99_04825 [bacterium]